MKPVKFIFIFLLLSTFLAFSITPGLVRKSLSKQMTQNLRMTEEEKNENEKDDAPDSEEGYLISHQLSWSALYGTIFHKVFIQPRMFYPEAVTTIYTPPPRS